MRQAASRGGASADTRVFVNNQNTRVATVTLPNVPKRPENAGEGVTIDDSDEEKIVESCDKNTYHKLKKLGESSPAQEIHPRLESVYHRVMRRLQYRANYGVPNAAPLAVRLGLVDGKGAHTNGKSEFDQEDTGKSLSTASPPTQHVTEIQPTSKRKTPTSSVGERLILSAASKSEDGDEGEMLARQPCPKTLCLVVEEVTNTIMEKLKVARVGSIKSCLCQVFECRSMLDRLLKEIPSYSQFQGDGERLLTPMRLQELYQEFRNQPAVLPNACYIRDPTSGRVLACTGDVCVVGNNPAVPGVSGVASTTEATEQPKVMLPDVGPPSGTVPLAGTWVGSAARKLPQSARSSAAPLPESYGKSSRVIQKTVIPGGGHKPNNSNVSSGGGYGKVPSVSPRCAEADDFSWPEGVRHSCNVTGDDRLSEVSPSTSMSRCQCGTKHDIRCPKQWTAGKQGELSEVARRHWVTQRVSVGTVTDENSGTTVTYEKYEELLSYVESLHVEIEEKKHDIAVLQGKLDEELAYTSRKKKVVEYLRDTLYKECSALRAQLSLEQQKQLKYQAIIKERQMQLQGTPGQGGVPYGHAMTNTHSSDRRTASSLSRWESVRPMSSGLPRSGAMESTRIPNGSTNDAPHRLKRFGSPVCKRGVISEEREDALSFDEPLPECGGSSGALKNFCSGQSRQVSGNKVGNVARGTLSVDCVAIQSLLDLVLLAVENDEVLPAGTSKARNVNLENIAKVMVADPVTADRKALKEFQLVQRKMKESYIQNRNEMVVELNDKEKELTRLRNAADKVYVEKFLKDQIRELKESYRHVRRSVTKIMDELWRYLYQAMDNVLNRATVVDSSLRDNDRLYSSYSALQDVITAASSLIGPMLTTEYAHGYHPWPLKLRNTNEPFRTMLRARYGEERLGSICEEVAAMNELYVAAHHYVTRKHAVPQLKRPAVGSALRKLCALMVLNTEASTELWQQVRDKYNREKKLQRHIALLNFSLINLMHRQRLLGERSAAALQEAGMDMKLMDLPVQRRVNKIAEEVYRITVERTAARRQRLDNARDVYRIWKATQINIYEGYGTPALPPRLTLISYGSHGTAGKKAFNPFPVGSAAGDNHLQNRDGGSPRRESSALGISDTTLDVAASPSNSPVSAGATPRTSECHIINRMGQKGG
uniref:Uncharacterized protein n=1 Tax=Trypanosoma congolense (strain IL3000) TaxID=1068625 RepID=G0V034_TRYCI|nr:conserved hypothetical protein [Trypanosoma congolense IL3000]